MKKLSNISPFILLLVPVFMMILLIFTTNMQTSNDSNEMASRSNVKSSQAFLKVKY